MIKIKFTGGLKQFILIQVTLAIKAQVFYVSFLFKQGFCCGYPKWNVIFKSYRCGECIAFLIKHLQSWFLKSEMLFTSIFTSVLSSYLLPLLAH